MKAIALTTHLYARLTGTQRIRREIVWGTHSAVYNIFRAFELVFGRKYGVRKEVSAQLRPDGTATYEYHTLEAALIGLELAFYDLFKFPKLKLVKVYVPVLAPAGGYKGLSGSPYVFAIARDSGLDAQSTSSYSFNNVAGDFMTVGIRTASGETVTGITYNSVAMTNSTQVTFDPGDRIIYIWTLKSPATGSNTVAISGPTVYRDLYTASYSGCDTTTNPGNTNTATGSGTSLSLSITTNAAGDWTAAAARDDAGNLASGTNWTPLGAATSIQYGDSNASVGSGSVTVQVTGPSGNLYMCALVIRAAAASGPANLKSLDTNVKANIKSYNTNVLANIKSINTNA